MKFIVTKELGKLARWLRLIGFDTVYFENESKGSLIIEALRDDRIIITRTREKIDDLQKKTIVVTKDAVQEQLKEVIQKSGLKVEEERMFTRCTLCNDLLVAAQKEEVKPLVPERVYNQQAVFKKCSSCSKVYWQGSHFEKVKKVMAEIRTKVYS
ncbi:MAG: Mut7-C RNAse domain-containing protein [Candidatus Omnitrophica bacterium]|nr:Mut7-C RNAse domain-containing protein [Candidatus Omnitrophota bacterium]